MPLNPQRNTRASVELDILFDQLRTESPDSEKYSAILDQIVKVHKLTAEERQPQVSPDTLIMAGTNLLGIILVLHYERLDIVTTKAMSMILKPR